MKPSIRGPLIAVVLALFTASGLAAEPDSQLRIDADKYWNAHQFSKYVETWRTIDAERPTFASAFNIALGLFRSGSNAQALSAANKLGERTDISDVQRARLKKLREEILSEMRFAATARERYTGSATLSAPRVRQANPVNRADNNRRGYDDMSGFSESQIQRMQAEHARTIAIANGYSAPVQYSDVAPESEP